MKNFKALLFSLALFVFITQLSPGQEETLYETGAQLLAGVNEGMREMGYPELSYEGLIVRLASQTRLASKGENVSAVTIDFLKKLIAKEKFTNSVFLITESKKDINLTDDVYSRNRLALPLYYCLTLQIPHIPWNNSKDARGQQMKINSDFIQIATALEKEEAEPARPGNAAK